MRSESIKSPLNESLYTADTSALLGDLAWRRMRMAYRILALFVADGLRPAHRRTGMAHYALPTANHAHQYCALLS